MDVDKIWWVGVRICREKVFAQDVWTYMSWVRRIPQPMQWRAVGDIRRHRDSLANQRKATSLASYVVLVDKDTPVSIVFDAVAAGWSRGSGRPALYWKYQVDKDLGVLGSFNWRQTVVLPIGCTWYLSNESGTIYRKMDNDSIRWMRFSSFRVIDFKRVFRPSSYGRTMEPVWGKW